MIGDAVAGEQVEPLCGCLGFRIAGALNEGGEPREVPAIGGDETWMLYVPQRFHAPAVGGEPVVGESLVGRCVDRGELGLRPRIGRPDDSARGGVLDRRGYAVGRVDAVVRSVPAVEEAVYTIAVPECCVQTGSGYDVQQGLGRQVSGCGDLFVECPGLSLDVTERVPLVQLDARQVRILAHESQLRCAGGDLRDHVESFIRFPVFIGGQWILRIAGFGFDEIDIMTPVHQRLALPAIDARKAAACGIDGRHHALG